MAGSSSRFLTRKPVSWIPVGDTGNWWNSLFPFYLAGWMMRRMMLLGLLILAGCQNTIGPLANRNRERPDQAQYDIEEQKRRGRDRYSLPDDSPLIGPRTGISGYGPTGR
jgi:hypothetical protein